LQGNGKPGTLRTGFIYFHVLKPKKSFVACLKVFQMPRTFSVADAVNPFRYRFRRNSFFFVLKPSAGKGGIV
jgi:hypothetical protein